MGTKNLSPQEAANLYGPLIRGVPGLELRKAKTGTYHCLLRISGTPRAVGSIMARDTPAKTDWKMFWPWGNGQEQKRFYFSTCEELLEFIDKNRSKLIKAAQK